MCNASAVMYIYTTRNTPIEALHTLLLGPYKYLLKTTVPKLSTRQKEEVLARQGRSQEYEEGGGWIVRAESAAKFFGPRPLFLTTPIN